jgi:electron-transferring-flavoprotein dehydrogenase
MAKSWLNSLPMSGGVSLGGGGHLADHMMTGLGKDYRPINYPKPDDKLTFDLLTNLTRSNTNHEEDQPSHLKIKPGHNPSALLGVYGGPETRFCPAGVYESIDKKLQINAQNCIHCKACDIKTPNNYIEWTVPEGTGGPF